MKIVIICFTRTESAPVFSIGIAKAMIKNGVDVYAIVPKGIENIVEWETLFDRTHIFVWKAGASIKRHPLNVLNCCLKLRKHFEQTRFEYAFSTFPNKMDLLIRKHINFKQSIMVLHDPVPHSSTNSKGTKIIEKVANTSDNIVVLSKQFIPYVIKKYNKREDQVLYMRHGAMNYPIHGTLIDSAYKINFLYFGRIDGYKGLHILSRAYEKLSQNHEGISLTVAGNGNFAEYEDEYAHLKNTIVINKYITNEEISSLFEIKNTVLVLPYTEATQSGVIGTAFNYGVPVIVSDTGGIKEQLFDGEMGVFVEPNNIDDLVKKMEYFINNRKLYEEQVQLMKNGRERTLWINVIKDLIYILRNKVQ